MPLRAEAEAGDDFAPVHRLAISRDRTALDQVNDAVGDHFRVNTEIFLSLQKAESACGMRPMPNSIVEPSSISAARYSAICFVVSVAVGRRDFEDGGL